MSEQRFVELWLKLSQAGLSREEVQECLEEILTLNNTVDGEFNTGGKTFSERVYQIFKERN
jgi:hypothetical protein